MAGIDRFKLTFADGEVREVERRPIHHLRAEAVSGGLSGGSYTNVYASMWAADTGGKGDRKAFEKWVESLDDWEKLPDLEDTDADPPASGGITSPG